MALSIFHAVVPYFGGKRRLCPIIFKQISKYIPRGEWQRKTFVDAFLGSGAVSLYAKAQGFRVVCNDVAERSYIAGQALIENNFTKLTKEDVYNLFLWERAARDIFIEKQLVPDVFPSKHAEFLNRGFYNAIKPTYKQLMLKYIFHIRPYSKFSSPNAFNRPFEEGRFDQIKETYRKHIKDNLKPPHDILLYERDRVNAGIFCNGHYNKAFKSDVFDFIDKVEGDVLYLDPPYAGTLAYESEYRIIDMILKDTQPKSPFSVDTGMVMLDKLLEKADKLPLWVISFGNAGGKNSLDELVEIVSRYRRCEASEFEYKHCEAMASEEHKRKSREWVVCAWK